MWTVQAGLLLRCGMSGRWGPALVWRLGLRSLSWLLVPELPTAFRAGVHEPPKVSGAGDRRLGFSCTQRWVWLGTRPRVTVCIKDTTSPVWVTAERWEAAIPQQLGAPHWAVRTQPN